MHLVGRRNEKNLNGIIAVEVLCLYRTVSSSCPLPPGAVRRRFPQAAFGRRFPQAAPAAASPLAGYTETLNRSLFLCSNFTTPSMSE